MKKTHFSKKQPIHIIGGGGVGMSGIARLFLHLGYSVSASDLRDSEYLKSIENNGGVVWVGHAPERISFNSVIIYSSAIPESDPERQVGSLVLSRHLALEFLSSYYYVIAITGTHGKTTTTAMLAHSLIELGFDPSVLVGGKVHKWGSNVRIGDGKLFDQPLLVVEADESDGSFLYLNTNLAGITNIEMDHPDQYNNFAQIKNNFEQFQKKVFENGGSVIFSEQIKPSKLRLTSNKVESIAGEKIQLKIPGKHNLLNSTVVLQILNKLGISLERSLKSLESFSGVARRLETLGKVKIGLGEFSVIDDYAHHPTEIIATLKALKESDPSPLIAIWEGHRLSRIHYFFDEFDAALSLADFVLRLPFFISGENPKKFSELFTKIKKWKNIPEPEVIDSDDISAKIKKTEFIFGRIVFLGAGNSSYVARALVNDFGK